MSFALSFKEEKLQAIFRRRDELIDKAAQQRRDLGDIHRQMERPLLWADWGLSTVRILRDNPILVSVGFAALMKFIKRKGHPEEPEKPKTGLFRRMMGLPLRAIQAWRIIGQIGSLFFGV